MFIVFDKNIKPKKTIGTHYTLTMNIENMVLYTNVLQFYIKGIYYGETLSNIVFDSLWNKIYKKFDTLDKPETLLYKKILSSITSIYEFMQNNFSSGISFIHQTLDAQLKDFKLESKDKHDVFKFLWEHTDKILFDIPTIDTIMMLMLLFTKILIIQCIDDPDDRRIITANWTGSYIINYICNNDEKFHTICEKIFDDPRGSFKHSIKNILKKHKIPVAISPNATNDSESLCKWVRFRYFGKMNKLCADARGMISDKISDYLRCKNYKIDDRHKIIFEMWVVINSTFGNVKDTDVYTELELIKIQSIITENNAIDVLRKIRHKLRSNEIIAINDDNISSFMDVDLYNMTLKIANDMCASIGNNKNKKYIQI